MALQPSPEKSGLTRSLHSDPIGTRVFFLVSVFVLFLGFNGNAWRVAEQVFFDTHQIVMESFIVGRIVRTAENGLFSSGGLPGLVGPDAVPPDIENANYEFQYRAYRQSLAHQSFAPYKSQIGGQGMLFGVLNSIIPSANTFKLDLFHGLTSLFSAAALALILAWLYREFGWPASAAALATAVLSQWLTVFGRNLWWSIWAFYLPLVMLLHYLDHRGGAANLRPVRFGAVVWFAVWIKCFFNGYEYITTTLIMLTVPIVYYSVRDRIGWRNFLAGMLTAVAASILSVLASMTALCIQIAAVDGSLARGIEHIANSFLRRTYADPQLFQPDYAASLTANPLEVVFTYLKGIYFDLNHFLAAPNDWIANYVFQIRYLHLILLFAAASIMLFLLLRKKPAAAIRPAAHALMAAVWFSLLAPLSWLIIFKAHSYVHTFMNNLVWQMPFTLFGFALCGLALHAAARVLRNRPA
ncbi:MAG: hypothetical protein JW748_15045 [Anaerolineales bacterium]|nr:hypothetical protein [Anaerolineales bacterium]